MGLYGAVRPLLFALPAEPTHRLGTAVLRAEQAVSPIRRGVRWWYQYRHPSLATERFGLDFPTPVGVAAGFDKNAEVLGALADLGFGFVEAGTVTPEPQEGNPRPRLFRLPADRSMINRLGLNSHGADRVADRLDASRPFAIPVGVNLGKMNDATEAGAVGDYRRAFDRLAPYGDYCVVNVSCPNTSEEFDQTAPTYLTDLLEALVDEAAEDIPLLVKIGPDASDAELGALVDVVESFDLDGIVATNTTTAREGLVSPQRYERGGLSGKPLEARSTAVVSTLYEQTDIPIVGVGGIDSAESAYRKIRAGASLVQLYTGFVYRGPSLARDINAGLHALLEEDGFDSVAAAVGADAE